MNFASKGAHQVEAAKARQRAARDSAKAQRRNSKGKFAPNQPGVPRQRQNAAPTDRPAPERRAKGATA